MYWPDASVFLEFVVMMLGSPAGRHRRRAFCLQPLPAWPGAVARHLTHDNPARKIIVGKDDENDQDKRDPYISDRNH
jgi:hypothetical protein